MNRFSHWKCPPRRCCTETWWVAYGNVKVPGLYHWPRNWNSLSWRCRATSLRSDTRSYIRSTSMVSWSVSLSYLSFFKLILPLWRHLPRFLSLFCPLLTNPPFLGVSRPLKVSWEETIPPVLLLMDAWWTLSLLAQIWPGDSSLFTNCLRYGLINVLVLSERSVVDADDVDWSTPFVA